MWRFYNYAMEKAIFAAGCFWGVQHYFDKAPGVLSTIVGYSGGHKDNPSYEDVCSKKSGHLEVIEVTFDPTKTSYENLLKLFFEIHDFEQTDGQGPDLGEQYLSAIFYINDLQKEEAEKIISQLIEKGYHPATSLRPATKVWPAEEYHQHYYNKTGKEPYCHFRKKIF